MKPWFKVTSLFIIQILNDNWARKQQRDCDNSSLIFDQSDSHSGVLYNKAQKFDFLITVSTG